MFLTISKINNKRKIWNGTHPTNHHRETTSLAHDSQSLFLSLLNLVLKYSYRSLSGKKSRNIYNVIQNIYWKHKISNQRYHDTREKSKKLPESYFFVAI